MNKRIIPAARLTVLLGILAAAQGLSAGEPVPPGRVTLVAPTTLAAALAAVEKQTGIKVDTGSADPAAMCSVTGKERPFWETLDALAAASGTRIAVGKQGRHVSFVKPTRPAPAPAAGNDGAFRVSPRGVSARTDLETGQTTYELALDVNWEPRFPVFRVDSQPHITAGADDRGAKLTSPSTGSKSPVSPAVFTHPATVRLDGLSRLSGKIASLSGTFTVTAAPKMLTFRFDDLGAPGNTEQQGVSVRLVRFAREEARWEAEFDLQYPAGQPEFESFETWASGNVLKLVAPGTGKVFSPDNFDLTETSRRVRATYRFLTAGGKGPDLSSLKGWHLVYETPAPLVEFPVRFTLKDIPLP